MPRIFVTCLAVSLLLAGAIGCQDTSDVTAANGSGTSSNETMTASDGVAAAEATSQVTTSEDVQPVAAAPDTTATDATGLDTQDPPAEVAVAIETVTLASMDKAAFDAELQKHQGKLILVDCWATWCPPCVKQFPHSMELARQHADAGLVVITMSFDDVDSDESVRKFLANNQAVAGNVINGLANTGDDDPFDVFEIDNGALPNYRLYDRGGKLVRKFVSGDPTVKNPFKPKDIDEAIDALLSEPGT